MTDIEITFVEVEPDVVFIAELPEIPSGGGGGGAVDSVNGKTGVVVLNYTDVGAAASVHTHDAGAVVSGTFSINRIPTGTSGTTVALGNHLHTGVYDPAGSAATAQANAIATASADATAKANQAETDAVAAAALDATTKANNAQTNAINAASSDATTKANTAENNAKSYTDAQAVKLTGAQTVGGVKTFSSSPIVPDPTTAQQAASKAYVDSVAGGFFTSNWKGVYNSGTTYHQDDVVRSANAKGMYRCKVASSVGIAPPTFVPGSVQQFYEPNVPPNHDADATPLTMGIRFTPQVDGFVNGAWFYKGTSNTGTHVIRLWNDGTSALIGGPATVTGETASGWQYMAFPSPIAVVAGTTYVIATDCPNGNYEFHSQFYTAGPVTRGQIVSSIGVFTTSVGTKPSSTFGNNYYSTDPDFTTGTPSPDNWEIMVLAS